MASSDHTTNVETAKSKSPSPSSESPNNVNTNEETKAAKETTVADTKQPEIKDVEMQDAEVACDKPDIVGETNETVSDLKASKRSESSEKQRDESGQDHVLGEVATLLKQVQESETKGKIEVEVKVKKMDHGDVKENGEVVRDEDGRSAGGRVG
ncbi:hypothetical protein HanPSC8_Chr16g0696141 [Helianthus annuus]|nr:hypothetical protein HanPSC8_Chr16g0696141 [Helianthus annuus]